MIVAIPREIKADEYRVAITPTGVSVLKDDGHTVLLQSGAGEGAGFDDRQYASSGAEIISDAESLYRQAELVVKVKEPLPEEIAVFRKELVVFGYFHFASSRELTERCLAAGFSAVAYETVTDSDGYLPLLAPMSEVAGKLATQQGAKYLEKPMGGRGVLLGGTAGVGPANVLVLGGGVVGTTAARIAAGMGAQVVIMDIDHRRLHLLNDIMPANVSTVYCDRQSVRTQTARADLVIGAVLIPGAKTPKLITSDMLKDMKDGSVIVDVCVDQGGCVETAKPTTHRKPTYVVDGVVHYCVANMPSAVSRTSTQALCNATLPYARNLARAGLDGFCAIDAAHAAGLNMRNGKLTHPALIEAFEDLPCQ